jgi:hypothetical protein
MSDDNIASCQVSLPVPVEVSNEKNISPCRLARTVYRCPSVHGPLQMSLDASV